MKYHVLVDFIQVCKYFDIVVFSGTDDDDVWCLDVKYNCTEEIPRVARNQNSDKGKMCVFFLTQLNNWNGHSLDSVLHWIEMKIELA